MNAANTGAGSPASGKGRSFHRLRAAALGISVLFLLLGGAATWIIYKQPRPVDFLSYWAAGELAVTGRIDSVYDMASHRMIEMTAAPMRGLLPFVYPPPFLLLVTPFGLLPYWGAFGLWLLVTYALFVAASALVAGKRLLPFGLSMPGSAANFLIGQNGFLTSSIFMAGTKMLDRAPLAGGAILGLLIIKPQLALLVPIALLAGRQWKAIAGAALSSAAFLLVAALVVGVEGYRAFFGILPVYAHGLAGGLWPWNKLASTFAFLRFFGVPQNIALAVHALIGVGAAAVTWRAFRYCLPNRAAVLAAATMLVPPYLFTYDSLFLTLPVLMLTKDERQPAATAAIWLCCFLPVTTYFGWYTGPNTIPLGALFSLWALHAPSPAPKPAPAA